MADQNRLEDTKKQLEAYLGRKLEPSGKLNELLEILNKFSFLPKLNTTEFTYPEKGSFNPLGGIKLTPSSGIDESTAAHEYTHALDNAMMFRADDWTKPRSRQLLWGLFNTPRTPQQAQFAEAYTKLTPSATNLPNKPEYRDYRGGNREMRAHGVGEQIKRGNYPAAPHIDPTMATEFDILIDLFKRTGLEPTIK
jgi:hypothetical protein